MEIASTNGMTTKASTNVTRDIAVPNVTGEEQHQISQKISTQQNST